MKDLKENNMDKLVWITILGFVTNHVDKSKQQVLTTVPTLKNKGIHKATEPNKDGDIVHFVRPVYAKGRYNATDVSMKDGDLCYEHIVTVAAPNGKKFKIPTKVDGLLNQAKGIVEDQDGNLDKTNPVKKFRYNKFFAPEYAELILSEMGVGTVRQELAYNLLSKKARERYLKTLEEKAAQDKMIAAQNAAFKGGLELIEEEEEDATES
jgi:hypothetical protein